MSIDFRQASTTELSIIIDALSSYRAELRIDNNGVVMSDARFAATATAKRQELHDRAKDMLESAKTIHRLR